MPEAMWHTVACDQAAQDQPSPELHCYYIVLGPIVLHGSMILIFYVIS